MLLSRKGVFASATHREIFVHEREAIGFREHFVRINCSRGKFSEFGNYALVKRATFFNTIRLKADRRQSPIRCLGPVWPQTTQYSPFRLLLKAVEAVEKGRAVRGWGLDWHWPREGDRPSLLRLVPPDWQVAGGCRRRLPS